jgi:predicted metalloprotease with PDZ domain
MLWVSEGFTVYYEDIVLRRAGLLTRDEVLTRASANIARYENAPGHLFQSATESSFDTWIKFMGRNENIANTTISYYDKGAVLGLLLDLRIRNETQNRKSLDDVMRGLYAKYYKERKRGFTDEEFREECDSAAGVPLSEVFEYAATVKDIDYPKYFAYAGLDIDMAAAQRPSAFLGATAEFHDGSLVISSIEWDSPAQHSGLMAQDQILALDDTRVNAKSMDEMLKSRNPGDKIKVLLSRHNSIREMEVVLGQSPQRSFKIKLQSNPSPLAVTILKNWMEVRF